MCFEGKIDLVTFCISRHASSEITKLVFDFPNEEAPGNSICDNVIQSQNTKHFDSEPSPHDPGEYITPGGPQKEKEGETHR